MNKRFALGLLALSLLLASPSRSELPTMRTNPTATVDCGCNADKRSKELEDLKKILEDAGNKYCAENTAACRSWRSNGLDSICRGVDVIGNAPGNLISCISNNVFGTSLCSKYCLSAVEGRCQNVFDGVMANALAAIKASGKIFACLSLCGVYTPGLGGGNSFNHIQPGICDGTTVVGRTDPWRGEPAYVPGSASGQQYRPGPPLPGNCAAGAVS